jgi:hypothetical protein
MEKNLQLSLKIKWFEMTKAGIKTEDYREITPYWIKRLCFKPDMGCVSDFPIERRFGVLVLKQFSQNTMTLGYPKSTDTDRILILEHKGIEIRTGNPEWGAEPNKLYFVIKHGLKK